MERGGQAGNKNAVKAKKWRESILRALAKASITVEAGLDATAQQLVALAQQGDKWAIDHIADRIDGKVAQAIVGGDADDEPIKIQQIERLIVSAKTPNPDG